MFLFEKENGRELDQGSIRAIEKEELAGADPPEIAGLIIKFLESSPNDDPLLGTAIFALGTRYDPSLKGLFVKMLRRTLDNNPHALYQTLVALDNLDGNVLQGDSCLNEYEQNKRLAEDYLKRVA